MILIVYDDGIILSRYNLTKIERLKRTVASEFEVRDLRQMRYFFGVKIVRSKDGISVS